jgi:hypothetical protein
MVPVNEEAVEPPRRRSAKLDHSWARTLAAVVGTLPVALAIGVAFVFALPLALPARYVVGSFGVPLLWVMACCRVFLAGSGKRAWLELLATLIAAGAIALIASILRTSARFWV